MVIMENSAEHNDEKTEPNIVINKKMCKVVNNENYLEKNEVLKLIEIIQTNNITSLHLTNCQLLDFPLNICSLDCINELNISGNKLKKLPDEFINLKILRFLDISNNVFQEFPPVLYNGLHLIKFLNVSNNEINLMSKPPCCLAKLEHLNLSSNNLAEPPSWLLNNVPSSLVNLDLSNNPCFENYSDSKGDSCLNKVAGKIKTLKVSDCRFREAFFSYVLNFSNVSTLDIGNNCIKRHNANYVASFKCNLPTSIEKLLLGDIGLGNVPCSVTALPNLRYLDVSSNMIHWLPNSFQRLKTLTVLHAKACNLCIIPPQVNELVSLKELHVSSNQLSSSEGFENIPSLEVIDLYGNQFISWPDFQKFPKLHSLDLCQNYVEPPSVIEINDLKHDYADLKANLRSKIKNCNRLDGEREFIPPPEDDLIDDVLEDSEEEEYCGPAPRLAIDVLTQHMYNPFHGCWETDETEYFDPNEWTSKQPLPRQDSYENLMGEIPYEVKIHPHYFNPYHLVTPVVNKAALPPPVEGQFDD